MPAQPTIRQRLVLSALCEPLLVRTGPQAVPATYAQMGRRLGRQPQYVRNVVKSLRESLSGHGIPGLTPDDEGFPHDDFRWALARWAVRTGVVRVEDLRDLPPEPEGEDDGPDDHPARPDDEPVTRGTPDLPQPTSTAGTRAGGTPASARVRISISSTTAPAPYLR
jgi:hypothetical protein